MSYTQTNSVTVNKLTLSQYETLKASGGISSTEVYSITDIDDYLYYSVRVGRIIPIGNIIYLNSGFTDYSAFPLNTILMRLVGTNGASISLKIINSNGSYILGAFAGNNKIQDIAHGSAVNAMTYDVQYIQPTSGYGVFAKVDYIFPMLLGIIDNVTRINCTF